MNLGTKRYLVVDLDRTFIKSDTAFQDFCLLVKRKKLSLVWHYFFEKRSVFKHRMVDLRKDLPVDYQINPQFYAFILQESKVRPVYLITGANIWHAQNIARAYPFFKLVVASTVDESIKPHKKLEWLEKKGISNFDYAGDRFGDMVIFKRAHNRYIVNPTLGLALFLTFRFQRNLNYHIFDLRKGLSWLRFRL